MISPEKIEGAERWAAHYGSMGIFISRLLPVVRHLIGIPAGIVRMDYIYDDSSKKPFLLEINTVPGQSEASIVPQQVRAMGWTLKEFYSALIDECFK